MSEISFPLMLWPLLLAVLVPTLLFNPQLLRAVPRLLRRALLCVWPVSVIGNDHVGWSARLPGDKNMVWAARRETAVFGCRQRALER